MLNVLCDRDQRSQKEGRCGCEPIIPALRLWTLIEMCDVPSTSQVHVWSSSVSAGPLCFPLGAGTVVCRGETASYISLALEIHPQVLPLKQNVTPLLFLPQLKQGGGEGVIRKSLCPSNQAISLTKIGRIVDGRALNFQCHHTHRTVRCQGE